MLNQIAICASVDIFACGCGTAQEGYLPNSVPVALYIPIVVIAPNSDGFKNGFDGSEL